MKASVVDGLFLKIAFETRGPILPEGDAQLGGVTYRVAFDLDKPFATGADSTDADIVWTIRGTAQGAGVVAAVAVAGRPGTPRREPASLRA